MAVALVLGLGWPVRAESYVAYSLREAARLAQTDQKNDPKLTGLGGITRIAGFVYDRDGRDLILVGEIVADWPSARLDDLVLALRMRLVDDVWPLVSIDPLSDTPRTGLYYVVFHGPLAGTTFGEAMLECDILLKQYSLGALAPIDPAKSYKDLSGQRLVEAIQAKGLRVTSTRWLTPDKSQATVKRMKGRAVRTVDVLQSRFWFEHQSGWDSLARDDVFCINDLRVTLAAKLDYAGNGQGGPQSPAAGRKDAAANAFATGFAQHLGELAGEYPRLKCLKILFDMMAVAEGVRELKERPNLEFLLNGYSVTAVPTAKTVKAIEQYCVVERSDRVTQAVCLSGGIELRPEIKWLNEGDVSQLRKAVLQSRPGAQALTWPLDLAGWNMPNCEAFQRSRTSESDPPRAAAPGSTLRMQTYTLSPPGVLPGPSQSRFNGFVPPMILGSPHPGGGTPPRPDGPSRPAGGPHWGAGTPTRPPTISPPAPTPTSVVPPPTSPPIRNPSGVLVNPNPVRDPAPVEHGLRQRVASQRPNNAASHWPIEAGTANSETKKEGTSHDKRK
jgi:hypothetical protein